MKSAVENLDPTRVRLTVEVPFEELTPSLDAAYKKIAQQVNVPGFRRGKVPPMIIDQRFGRAVVIEEAVNEALPQFYGKAVEENKLEVVGRPNVDLSEIEDGAELKFTAEVDVRPEITLPDYQGIEATVDDAVVTDEQVEEQLNALRDRFSTLTAVERAAEAGDYVTIDLRAEINGEELEDGTAADVSYEIGSGTMVEGLDEAVTGKSAGEVATFSSKLVGGVHAGESADITVTVKGVKAKELPELDDEFAAMASEFDTLGELRDDARVRLERMARQEQAAQARDRVLEKLLERVDVPLPKSVVEAELDWRKQSLDQQLQATGMTREGFFKLQDKTAEEFEAELDKEIREGVKAQFILDKLADTEQLSVNQEELTRHLIQRAAGSGMSPDQFAQQVVQANQVPALVGEVRRGKALQLVLEAAAVTDASGAPVDIKAFLEDEDAGTAGAAADGAAESESQVDAEAGQEEADSTEE